jgi:type IV secretion system protein TrbL
MRYRLGYLFLVLLVLVLGMSLAAHAQAVDVHSVVDTLLAKYRSAGQSWTRTIQSAATKFFWLLATISLGWTCISMAIKQSRTGCRTW